jgi:hypothetical protein
MAIVEIEKFSNHSSCSEMHHLRKEKNHKNQEGEPDDDLLWLCIATGITCFGALVYTIYLWIL